MYTNNTSIENEGCHVQMDLSQIILYVLKAV